MNNIFNNIVEKIVLYFYTLYDCDIEYHNEVIDPAFNYKYIYRKLNSYTDADDIKLKIKLKIKNIIDSEIPDRLFDDEYYKIVKKLTDLRGYDEDEYFEDDEDTEDGRIINYERRYDVNIIEYLELFILNEEFINNLLDNLQPELK